MAADLLTPWPQGYAENCHEEDEEPPHHTYRMMIVIVCVDVLLRQVSCGVLR
jgi:hypothetical protein